MKMERNFSVGEKLSIASKNGGELFAEITGRTGDSVMYNEYEILPSGKKSDVRKKISQIIRRDLWDEKFEKIVGVQESFLGWGDVVNFDDGEIEHIYAYFFPKNKVR